MPCIVQQAGNHFDMSDLAVIGEMLPADTLARAGENRHLIIGGSGIPPYDTLTCC